MQVLLLGAHGYRTSYRRDYAVDVGCHPDRRQETGPEVTGLVAGEDVSEEVELGSSTVCTAVTVYM